MNAGKTILVGDNPFHGVSHLSQDNARSRDPRIFDRQWAATLVQKSFENGANGFMFSVSETTLGILSRLPKQNEARRYYAIVPAAGDYVRLSSQVGTTGILTYVARQVIKSGNIGAIAHGVKGAMFSDTAALMKAYLGYEISRIRNSSRAGGKLYSLLLHELVTEMAVALKMDWLLRTHVEYMNRLGIKPGFETRNFAALVTRLRELKIDTANVVITAPFNSIGFQMNPDKKTCEDTLTLTPEIEVIAMSILASGYIKLPDALNYIHSLPQLSGVVVGVSKEQHATGFSMIKGILDQP